MKHSFLKDLKSRKIHKEIEKRYNLSFIDKNDSVWLTNVLEYYYHKRSLTSNQIQRLISYDIVKEIK